MPPADAGLPPAPDLPDGWHAAAPSARDVPALLALRVRIERAARGWSSASERDVAADVVGDGAATRTHLLVSDADGTVRGWGTAHDRAAGRVLVQVAVDPDLPVDEADRVSDALFGWVEGAASAHALARGLSRTQLDSGAFEADAQQQRRLARAGFAHVRTWWQMRRPVAPADAEAGPPRPGVRVRRVAKGVDGMPQEQDLVHVHDVLEEAFTDHFNHHTETFEEFVARLREDPGHRWDHWWLAEITDEGDTPRPVGALVASASLAESGDPAGSYVDYLGVLGSARGRGVARSLLDAVMADAATRGRTSVSLEVDATSPTGAAGLYTSLGFVTSYVTQSWHRDLPVG